MNITRGKINKAQRVVVYGPEGIGKSTFASKFPEPLFIDTEGSTNQLDVARMDPPTSWTMLLQQINWVKNNPDVCKTLIIDTIDWAERLCVEHICAVHGKKGIEDFGYGNGYVYVSEEIGKFLNVLTDLTHNGINIVLTAHAQIRKVEQPEEFGGYDHWELKLGKKTSSQTSPLVKEWSDMLLFANYKVISIAVDDKGKKRKGTGGERVLYTSHHVCWDAKNRHGLEDELKFDFNEIAHIFNNQSIEQKQEDPIPEKKSDSIDTDMKDFLEGSDLELIALRHEGFGQEETDNISDRALTIKEKNNKLTWPQAFEEAKKEFKIEKLTSKEKETEVERQLVSNKSLNDLMILNNVSIEEIQKVVGQKGYYPPDTPIENYDEGFVDGVLVGAWNQVFEMIKNNR